MAKSKTRRKPSTTAKKAAHPKPKRGAEDIMLEKPDKIKPFGLIAGLLIFIWTMSTTPPEGLSQEGWHVVGVALLMAVWWVTEALPIAVTAMVPLIAMPLLGLGSIKDAAKGFTSGAIYLTLGGFLLGVALQKWQLHLRIAMNTVKLVGTEPNRIIAGFMLATAFLSMWITNTATTVMMMPIAFSVVTLLIKECNTSEETGRNFGIALMICLAYSATIGGMMTLVGTSTNVMFKGFFESQFGLEINFVDWMKLGVPMGLCMLAITWFMMTRVIYPCKLEGSGDVAEAVIAGELKKLGKMSTGETRTLMVFAGTAFFWMFRKPINEHLVPFLDMNDASIAIFGAMLLFIVPANFKKREYLLRWEDTKEVPWGILLLLGGGLTLAHFLNSTGVAEWMGHYIQSFGDIPLWSLIVLTTLLIIFLSELMSNVATLSAFLPVIVAVALGFGENPLTLAIPAALAASCAFMLPIGTPPNAIVFGSGLLKIKHMAKSGLWLNLIGILLINIVCALLLPLIFGVDYGVVPDWAAGGMQAPGAEIGH